MPTLRRKSPYHEEKKGDLRDLKLISFMFPLTRNALPRMGGPGFLHETAAAWLTVSLIHSGTPVLDYEELAEIRAYGELNVWSVLILIFGRFKDQSK